MNTANYFKELDTPNFYKISASAASSNDIYNRSRAAFEFDQDITEKQFLEKKSALRKIIARNECYAQLLETPNFPFIYANPRRIGDLGEIVTTQLIHGLQHIVSQSKTMKMLCKSQTTSNLTQQLEINSSSGQLELLRQAKESPIVGIYFPYAFKGLTNAEARNEFLRLPKIIHNSKITLSGPIDVLSAIIGSPEMLINKESYSPILTMPAVNHRDERVILLIKSYGNNLEFWQLSKMMFPGVEQKSEQMFSGISIYL